MGKFLKQLTAAAFSLILTVAGLVPLTRVYATDHGEGEYKITASVDSNSDWVASFTIDGEDWVAGDSYSSPDAKYSMTFELHIPNEDERANVGIRIGGDSGEFSFQQAGETEDWQGTHRKYTFTATYTTPSATQHVSINPYSEDNHGGEYPVEGDTEAHLSVACADTGNPTSCYDVSFAIGEAPYPSPYQENEEIVISYNSEEDQEGTRSGIHGRK